MSTARRTRIGIALAAFGAIAFSGKAIIVKLAYRWEVDAVTLLMLRMLFALPIFLAMAWWAGRGKLALTRKQWGQVVLLGVIGYYLSSFLDFIGLQYITASLERLILYLNPTLVLLLGWLVQGRRATRAQLAGAALSYAGIVLVFGYEVGVLGTQAVIGVAFVFASTVLYAVYLLQSGVLVQQIGSLRLVGLATSVACVFCVLQYAVLRPIGSALTLPPPVIWLSVLNATVCTALPVLLVMMGVERIGAAAASQTGLVGPLATIAMGVVLLGEPFTGWIAAGTALVVAGIWVFTRRAAAK